MSRLPQRAQTLIVLLVAGLNHMLHECSAEEVKEKIKMFEADVNGQNIYHIRRNELNVAQSS